MTRGNEPLPGRLNAAPARAWKTYTQRAHALNIPLRPIQPTGTMVSVLPNRAVMPFALMGFNPGVPQYHSPLIRPDLRYVGNPKQCGTLHESSDPGDNKVGNDNPFPSPVASEGDYIVPRSTSEADGSEATPTKSQGMRF
ncbi:hypothetical protein DFH28DRAFT_923278 [Melampsora americana]|nr:hypothetical protein DFH28DRAFT_923278 [Melampsora americana]